MKHLINSLSEISSLGVSFVSYQENIDLSTPVGKMMFHVIGAMAEFETALLKERVVAGIQNAQGKNGKNAIGRKPVPQIIVEKIQRLRKQGMSIRSIAGKLKLSVGLVHKTLKNLYSEPAVNT